MSPASYALSDHPDIQEYVERVWLDYYNQPLDDMPTGWGAFQAQVKANFYQQPWNWAYDFLEFTANNFPDPNGNLIERFIEVCNDAMRRYLSGYRFVGRTIAPVTSEQEIETIEQALAAGQASTPLGLVSNHLDQALSLLSDRQAPDYRNSIKESISAVEAICKLITQQPRTTLGAALSAIQNGNVVQVHSSLTEAFQKLYNFTSDAAGIRHAMKDASTVDQEDAMFMLVSCSAFVNYLVAKAVKAGITL